MLLDRYTVSGLSNAVKATLVIYSCIIQVTWMNKWYAMDFKTHSHELLLGLQYAACCRQLHCCREIEKFLSMHRRSLLQFPQTAASSLNEPFAIHSSVISVDSPYLAASFLITPS